MMKVSYKAYTGTEATAYVNEEPAGVTFYEGVDKHTDAPLLLIYLERTGFIEVWRGQVEL